MTTEVIIKAHCASNKQVRISIDVVIIQDGETHSLSVYDSKSVTVFEQLKFEQLKEE